MEHNMEHNMEPLIDFNCNLAEMLAVDLQQSSSIFQSKQLTAGAPAPGLADDGARRRHSLPQDSSYLTPLLPSQPDGTSPNSNSKSLQKIHKKYSDIFAPLDFDSPKRGSVSSSDCSADFEPPSITTREESVLTVDTWLETEKHSIPILLHISPTSEYISPMSWIDLDGDDGDISPGTRRRRSSMTDFPKYLQQLRSPDATNVRPMSSRSRNADVSEASITPVDGNPRGVPQRRSSLKHEEKETGGSGIYHDTQHYKSFQSPDNESVLTYGESTDTALFEDQTTLLDNTVASSRNNLAFLTPKEHISSRPNTSWDRGLPIASRGVDYDEWVESDTNYFVSREKPAAPRQLSRHVQDSIEARVNNFPQIMLSCDDLLVEEIRELSQQAKYDTDDPKYDYLAISRPQTNNLHQSKPSRWKLLGSSTSAAEQQGQLDITRVNKKQAWAVMGKIFPHGSDAECSALYAYVLVYNYVTSLYLREMARSNAPRPATRPNTSRSGAYSESDSDISILTPPRPSGSEAMGIPKKAVRVLGLGIEEEDNARPPSGGSGSRTSTFTGLRHIPSLFFNPGQQRHNESRGIMTSSSTLVGEVGSLSRPGTPGTGRAGMRPMTSIGLLRLAELRRGIAMCCAGLTIALQRADPNITEDRPDKCYRVDPSFMRSLCQHVQITEDAIASSH
ncbi:hypothetical protein F4801DRAFT_265853 [Xylaria longipes]|nr:hypothetical protein F4801DRAFT_265853 [Xylaria longipes]RYC65230.1 hypothetical protein CHU98_g993 [Xylaria longipes]